MSLLDIVFTLALVALITAGTIPGISALQDAARIESGRMDLVMALGQARRIAYLREETVFAAAPSGTDAVVVEGTGDLELRLPLRGGVTIIETPARGGVHFAASGWAENGTFVLGWPGSDPTQGARVIVNQRGRIR
jgi:hypothetical protein